MSNKELIFVVNVDWFFLSHRLPIAIEAIKKGYNITLIAKNTGKRAEIETYGIKFIDLPFERSNVNLINEFRIYRRLKKIYKTKKPDIVHHVTLKPIILGTLAARTFKFISIVNAVSGLGILFTKDGNRLKRVLTVNLLKFIFRVKTKLKVIFQNNDDKKIFIDNKIINEKDTVLIKGSGVDLKVFDYKELPSNGSRKVLMAARMLYTKGFDDFSKAAKIVTEKDKYKDIEFLMAGSIDTLNPAAIKESVIKSWEKERNVKWLGHINDIKNKIEEAYLIVFPSFYGEGVPKFLIESCAIGRPIITTNHSGCRDCVDGNENGYLVEVNDFNELANKIMFLFDNDSLSRKFSKNSRLKAEKEFSIEMVVKKTIDIYNMFLSC